MAALVSHWIVGTFFKARGLIVAGFFVAIRFFILYSPLMKLKLIHGTTDLYPRCLRREEAAAYADMPLPQFNEMIERGILRGPLFDDYEADVFDRKLIDFVLGRVSTEDGYYIPEVN